MGVFLKRCDKKIHIRFREQHARASSRYNMVHRINYGIVKGKCDEY